MDIVATRIAEAQRLFREGRLEEAGAICGELLRGDPGQIEALLLVAELAFLRGGYDTAVAQLRDGVKRHPAHALLAYKLGCLLEESGDLPAAVDSYRAALRAEPSMVKAHNNLGATLQTMGKLEEAGECFLRARALDPQLWQAHYNLGNWYKFQGRVRDAVVPFQTAMRLRRAPGPQPPALASLSAGTSRSKLRHDAEQLRYLVARGILPAAFGEKAAALERAAIELEPQFRTEAAVPFPPHLQAAADDTYNRLLNFFDAPAMAGPAVNPRLDRQAIEADYVHNAPGITFVDDFLSAEALGRMRRFCLESTIWFDFLYTGGYVGASFEEGFACPLLAQIAEELPRALPAIFGDHPLTHLWGYKYDSQRSGIGEHADFAAVNVNFWLTPDEANLEPDSGGLVIWDKEAPLDWDFDGYNREPARIRQFLETAGARRIRVPHRQNRVVIFNSDLFHKTDDYRFRPGYENRRINVTLLYGYRQVRDDPRVRA
jgi:thioredoxin-like negative regulator of GroEL